MPKKILVNVIPEEIRMALVEDQHLLEVAVERTDNAPILGNIYKGRVENVLPGLQAAFINIGLPKNAFLYAGDIFPHKSFQRLVKEDNLTVGADIMVEIVKDALGTKGPRATTHFSIPGRYIVLMPTVDYVGVSRRIESGEERARLRAVADKIRPKGMGLIVRTVAEGHTEEALVRDFQYLSSLWNALNIKAKRAKPPFLLYRDADLVIRIIRDYMKDDVEEVFIDNADAFARMVELAKYLSPDIVKRIHLYRGKTEIFSHYGIEDDWGQLMARRVDLKCGGYIIIDRTEALTVIDVNTGRFIGHTNLADTVFRANMEAAAEIARQLRLRDIGGIIVIDFIDMEKQGHKNSILAELESHLRNDNSKSNVLGLTELGLVEMTRKKARQTLEGTLYEECPCCAGRGSVQSPDTLIILIRRQLRKLAVKRPGADLVVQVHPRLLPKFGSTKDIRAFGEELGMDLTVETLETIHPEHYAIFEGEKPLFTSDQPKKVRKPHARFQTEEANDATMETGPLVAEDFALEAAADPEHSLEQKLAIMSDSFWEPMYGMDDDDRELEDETVPVGVFDEAAETMLDENPKKKSRRRRKHKKSTVPVVFDEAPIAAIEAIEAAKDKAPEEAEEEGDAAAEAPDEVHKKARKRRRRKKSKKETNELSDNVGVEEIVTEGDVAEEVLNDAAVVESENLPPKKKSKRRRRRKKVKISEGEAEDTTEALPWEDQLIEEMADGATGGMEGEQPAKKPKRRRRRKKKPAQVESGMTVEEGVAAAKGIEPAESAAPVEADETAIPKKTKRRRRRSSGKKKTEETQEPTEPLD